MFFVFLHILPTDGNIHAPKTNIFTEFSPYQFTRWRVSCTKFLYSRHIRFNCTVLPYLYIILSTLKHHPALPIFRAKTPSSGALSPPPPPPIYHTTIPTQCNNRKIKRKKSRGMIKKSMKNQNTKTRVYNTVCVCALVYAGRARTTGPPAALAAGK